MSENRNKYSSSPLHNLKTAAKKAKKPDNSSRSQAGAVQDDTFHVSNSYTLLQIMLLIALPIFFVSALLSRSNLLFLAFGIVSVICLMVMWLLSAFMPNARATLTIIHFTMILIALFAVLINPTTPAPQQSKANDYNLEAAFSAKTNINISDLTPKQDPVQPNTTPNPGSASFAQKRLEQFIAAWMIPDYKAMADCCLPAWVSAQEDPERAMFHIRANRSPVNYEILDISGNDSDQSRTVNLNILIDKNNGSEPLNNKFQLLMIRINNEWYVDPNSLSSLGVIKTEEQKAAEAVVTLIPTEPPTPDMQLYYNPKGGKFYHRDANCNSLRAEYKPLTSFFLYKDIASEQFKGLSPCGVCRAPSR